jgi:hypothetical protein
MEMTMTSVSLERRRFRSKSGITPVWLATTLDRLQSAMPDDELSGSLYFHCGKVRSIDNAAVQDLREAIAGRFDEIERVALSAGPYWKSSVQLEMTPRDGAVIMRVRGENEAVADTILARLVRDLALDPLPDDPNEPAEQVERKDRISISRIYRPQRRIDRSWASLAIETALRLAGEQCRFYGRLRLRPNDGEQRSMIPKDPAAWLDILQAHSANLAGAEFTASSVRGLTLRITEGEEVELSADAETEAECHHVLSEISEALGLEPLSQDKRLPYGLRRSYFARGRLDRQRLAPIIQACEAAVGIMDRFSGTLKFLRGPTWIISMKSPSLWLDELEHKVAEVGDATAWFYAPYGGAYRHRRVTLDINLTRSAVTLDVEAETPPAAENLMTVLEEAIGDRAPLANQPYRYRSASATFRFPSWSRENFAEAIEILAKEKLGKVGPPLVREAYISELTEGQTERLRGFDDLTSFLDAVRHGGQRLPVRIGLVLEGSQGRHCGIQVYIQDHRIEVRTSVPPEEFDEFISPLKFMLNLRPVEARPAGGSSVEAAAPQTDSVPMKLTLALLPTLLTVVLGVVGLEAWKAWRTDYEVRLLLPTNDASHTTKSRNIDVIWTLVPKNTLLRSREDSAPADVLVSRDGQLVMTRSAALPPTKLTLEPGNYRVDIRPSLPAPPKTFSLTIER